MSGGGAPSGRVREFGRFLEIQNLGLNLPFAIAFLLAAANGLPRPLTLALVVVAFVAARNAGHSFNRWADRELDAANPRTRDRALVTGRYSPRFALLVVALSAIVLLAAAYLLNWLSFLLAPVALAILFGYSYTKRYTAGTTVYLGLVEAITPAAAFIAVQGTLPPVAVPAILGILLWGSAFETVHSLGDLETDRHLGLKSIPVALGRTASIRVIPILHGAALGLFTAFAYWDHLGIPVYVALGAMAALTGGIDARLLRASTDTRVVFRAHFALGAIFLLGVGLATFLPGIPG